MLNTMPDWVWLVVSGIGGGLLFTLIKSFVFKKAKQEVLRAIPDEAKAKVKELYEQGVVSLAEYRKVCLQPELKEECFSTPKLVNGLTNLTSGTKWAKDLHDLFNLRKLIIVGVIIGAIYGYGWYKGRMGAPAHLDLHGKEVTIQLNEHFLKIEKDGTSKVIDKDGKVLKVIKVRDIPELRKAMRPYGFEVKPILVAGMGSSTSTGVSKEFGVGASWFKYYKWVVDSCITNEGAYPLGVSYKVTKNVGIGVSAGFGYKGDQRVLGKVTIDLW